MGVIVLVSLWWKGYIKLPTSRQNSGGVVDTPKNISLPAANPDIRTRNFTADELGVMFAKAKREEALSELDTTFAKTAGDTLKASFTAPFSPAAPGPAEPTKPGV